jgi:hypothetical protein
MRRFIVNGMHVVDAPTCKQAEEEAAARGFGVHTLRVLDDHTEKELGDVVARIATTLVREREKGFAGRPTKFSEDDREFFMSRAASALSSKLSPAQRTAVMLVRDEMGRPSSKPAPKAT